MTILSAYDIYGADRNSDIAVDSALTLVQRSILSEAPQYGFFSLPWDNPAARQYMMPFGISRITVNYSDRSLKHPAVEAEGRGERGAQVLAATYLKHKNSTLWGEAFYDNGRLLDLKWNETADMEMLYPYLTADSVGGDLKLERYAFIGGYADRRESWSWGVQLGYLAGIYYRSVDPRPRDITGCLSLKFGGGYRISDHYVLTVGLKGERYRQTNEIAFMSETFESKIYHCTGLGTHYVRFAGTGKNSRYDGWRYGGDIGLVTSRESGLVAALGIERFQFEKILSDLNRLPLVSSRDVAIHAECGFRTRRGQNVWMTKGKLSFVSRIGKENIFGDPSMSVYPMISSLRKYSRRNVSASVSALWCHLRGGLPLISVVPEFGYRGNSERYVTPDRRLASDDFTGALTLRYDLGLPYKIHCALMLRGDFDVPVNHSLEMDGTHLNDDAGLLASLENDFSYMRHVRGNAGIFAEFTRELGRKYAVRMTAGYTRMHFALGNHGNDWKIELSLMF